jgi:hypothetical protein
LARSRHANPARDTCPHKVKPYAGRYQLLTGMADPPGMKPVAGW